MVQLAARPVAKKIDYPFRQHVGSLANHGGAMALATTAAKAIVDGH